MQELDMVKRLGVAQLQQGGEKGEGGGDETGDSGEICVFLNCHKNGKAGNIKVWVSFRK